MLSRASAVSSTPQRMRTAGACWFAIGSGPELLGASLANAAATYAVYHGPIVLERIAKKVHFLSQILKSAVGCLFFLSGAQQGRLLIYELMVEESAINYWEKYGHAAFDFSNQCLRRFMSLQLQICSSWPVDLDFVVSHAHVCKCKALLCSSPEAATAIGDELGSMGCGWPGLRIVGFEMGKRNRLQSDILTEFITGIIVLHAERVTALSPEAFMSEHITSSMSPLQSIMKELQLRRVHKYPRWVTSFFTDVRVVRLFRLTEPMEAIYPAIVQCMTVTLSELKRSNQTLQLQLDDLNIESAYFRSFDVVVLR
ncbi:hypothetical protein EDD22DRAFT_957651 [Suillus occidentalis]|nr:hypothetical protein EDD22DRAFT_957651 [Suillus occidentalis]